MTQNLSYKWKLASKFHFLSKFPFCVNQDHFSDHLSYTLEHENNFHAWKNFLGYKYS